MKLRTERVFRAVDYWVYAILTLVIVGALARFSVHWVSMEAWGRSPGTLGVFTGLIGGQLALMLMPWILLSRMRRPVPMPVPMKAEPGQRVGVATTFVPQLESLEMLEETLRALVAMRTPHETWVLDEGDDDDVKALCERLGARYFSRNKIDAYQRETGPFKRRTKYGNVNAWLDAVAYEEYDFVASFDPDHVPEPGFLERVLGYFADDEIGYVQAAQVYYNQAASFIARGAAEETYAYYSSLQMSSFAAGYPIVTGCHNTHRVTALREVGGFAAHDADDLLATILYRACGWRGVYVPEILARGLTPVDWPAYLRQQLRWARSVLDVKVRHFPKVARDLPLPTRAMSLLHGTNYVTESLFAAAGVTMLVALLLGGGEPVLPHVLSPALLGVYAAIFGADFYRQRFFLDRKREWGLHWRAGLLRYAKWPWVLRALCEVVVDRRIEYSTTSKLGGGQPASPMLWPHWGVAGVVAGAWLIGSLNGGDPDTWLRFFASTTILVSLGLAASELRSFPDPFDPALLLRERRSWGRSQAP